MKIIIAFAFAMTILSMTDKTDSANIYDGSQGQKPLFSIGIIADVQYADYVSAGTRYYRSSPGKLREAVKTFKKDSVDFIVNLGDLIDKDFGSFKPILNIIDSSGIKTFHVTGNHDYSVDPRLKKRIPVLSYSKEGYYSLMHKNFRFIFLNGNEISTYASKNKKDAKKAEDYIVSLKSSGEKNAIDWNGGVSSAQIAWLASQLNDATLKNEKVFIMCHFPVFPENEHNLLNYREILSLLEKYSNIIAWFNGHNHSGNYGNFNLIHFITFKGMVETEKTNSYATIDVYKNKLWIKGYGREKSLILAY
jgi:manganese-dependent ADP-ribose/CDP-alcohol diphosphatase